MANSITGAAPHLLGRKGLLQLGLAAVIGSVVALPYLGVALRYLFPAAGGGGQAVRVALDTLEFTGGVAGPITYEFTSGQGDVTELFIVKEGTEYLALEGTCSHFGCGVAWNAAANRFDCPCHGGSFSRTGDILSGPIPLPLARHQAQVSGDQLVLGGRV